MDKFCFLSVILVRFSYYTDEETETMRKNLPNSVFNVSSRCKNYLSRQLYSYMYKINVLIRHVCAISIHSPLPPRLPPAHVDDYSLEVFFSD